MYFLVITFTIEIRESEIINLFDTLNINRVVSIHVYCWVKG